jgi:hypothetical protein
MTDCDAFKTPMFQEVSGLNNIDYTPIIYWTFEILKPPGTSFWKTPKGSYFFAAAFIFFTFSEP